MTFRLSNIFLMVAAWLCLAATPAWAQGFQSGWSPSSRSSVRLLTGEVRDGSIEVGIEIRLAPGYKTYWRSPGDSGVPPSFDWSGSENLAKAEVSWPLPTRFSDGAGHSIGYVSDVILPVAITAADPSRPVRLVLKLDYAVCERICIPAQASVMLTLPVAGLDRTNAALINAARARVPKRIELGRTGAGPRLAAARWQKADGGAGAAAQITLDCLTEGPLEAFVEGPEMWAFGVPRRTPAADGRTEVTIPIEDRPKSAAGRQRFTVTLAGGDRAVEVQVDLDIPPLQP